VAQVASLAMLAATGCSRPHDTLQVPIWSIPEYHDEQAFLVPLAGGSEGYGPVAHGSGSPELAKMSTIPDFDAVGAAGLLAAVVKVDVPQGGGSLPALYTSLNLAPGLNCVYLAHVKGEGAKTWHAYIVPGTTATICPDPVATPASGAVMGVDADLGPQGSPASDYPAVLRFGEAASTRQPLIGLPCANATCWIGPADAKGGPPHHRPPAHGANGLLAGLREGRIQLWHDEQQLGAMNAAGQLVPTAVRAAIIPFPGLAAKPVADFDAGWVEVAWIWIDGDPADTKYGPPTTAIPNAWGMHQQLNQLQLMRAKGGTWQARVVQANPDGTLTSVVSPTFGVSYAQHQGWTKPGTARFKWLPNDEGFWVPCDMGCCQVSAAQ
jgi:hypothetical protein